MLNSKKSNKKEKFKNQFINVGFDCVVLKKDKEKIEHAFNNIRRNRPNLRLRYYFEEQIEYNPDTKEFDTSNPICILNVKIGFDSIGNSYSELEYRVNSINIVGMFLRNYICKNYTRSISAIVRFSIDKTNKLKEIVKNYASENKYAKIATIDDKYYNIDFNYSQSILITNNYTEFEIEGAIIEGTTSDGITNNITRKIFDFYESCIEKIKVD